MRLVFLGTRANIDVSSRRHRRHSSLLARYRRSRIRIDCGEDWRGRAGEHAPDAIVLTHGHPDHAFGLRDGAPCPVYATAETWDCIRSFPIGERCTLDHRQEVTIGPFRVIAFAVEHSVNAPAVGLRVTAGNVAMLYLPDVIAMPHRRAALAGVALYVGDGSTITRPIVRRIDDAPVGHAPIRTQLGWCEKENVARALFTHCGTEIVGGDERTLGPLVRRLGRERGVDAAIAHDGLEVALR